MLAFFGLAALACVGAGPRDQAEGAAAAPEPASASSEKTPVNSHLLTAAPTTVEVAIPEDVRRHVQRHLGQKSLETVRLVVRDLRPEAADALKGVRLFLDRPDADAATPVDDPHYAGNFVLGLDDSQTFLWNIAPTLARIWRAPDLTTKKTLQVTFVPETWEPATRLSEQFALRFASVELEAPATP
ncbi:MAG: hypothetical protein ACREYF_19135 [Gammaproteobacteria bacterium]